MPARSAGRPPKTKYECGFHDVGNAERFVMRCGHAVRYCHAWGKWLVYDGQRWIRDGEAKAKQMVIETMREIHIQAAQASIDGDEAKCKKLNAWATASLSQRAISAALSLAATFPEIAIEPDELDANPWVMNCQNGTLDLVTCRLKPHRSEDLLTKLAPVDYDPDAKAPQWEAYVAQMMLGRPGLIDYLKRALGYALTGDVTEKALFLCYGGGDNGKTTMLEVFRHVCGDYAGAIQIESLLHTKSQSGRDASPDIAALLGKRFITTSEADEGARLNESRIKYLTGMGEIVARELHHEQFSFKPQFKLFLDTNYRPVIRGTDKGIWTRMRSIPFELQLTEEQKDKGLGERLKAEEASGILAWAIEGLMLYHESGIPAPEEVAAATAEYKHQMDSLGEFLEECTTVDPTLRAPARALYRCYQIFVKTSGEMPFGEKRFKASMLERGFGQVRTDEGMRYVGLALSRTVSDSGELTPVSSWS
jgi:putative DNA primase/helicase